MSQPHTTDRQRSSSAREALAQYFLSAPPYSDQTPDERRTFIDKLRQLGQIENREVLQAAGSHRPLVWDNPVPLIQNMLTAAQRLAAAHGQTLLLFPAADTSFRFQAMMHPRLLTLATANLLAAVTATADGDTVWVRLQEQEHCLTVSATTTESVTDSEALAVIQECARLHGGSLAQCDNCVAFSCSRVDTPPQEVRHYVCPTADELCRDTLSPLWTIFYSSVASRMSSDRTVSTGGNSSASSPKSSSKDVSEGSSKHSDTSASSDSSAGDAGDSSTES